MDISIIIVTYNVEDIIRLSLDSTLNAVRRVDGEIIVVDNASLDYTLESLKEYADTVHIIANTENKGFARGCHNGADVAKGRCLLFLNPDALIDEGYLTRVVSLMSEDRRIGTISPLLLDGSGKVLLETSRNVPSPKSAIKHLLGLGNSNYYKELTSVSKQNVPIVSGACLAISRETWDAVGGFDKRYFMYAEDVDLSYQVTKLGLSNQVLVDHPIIHLKGESTKKTSWSYNRAFYKSMSLFARKYKGDLYTPLEVFLIGLVTSIVSVASLLFNSFKTIVKPLRDLVLFVGILFAVQQCWAYIEYNNVAYFNSRQTAGNYLIYGCLWVFGILIIGGYFKERGKNNKVLKGYLIGWVLSVVLYAFLPEEVRSSRMILLIAGLVCVFFIWLRSKLKSRRAGVVGVLSNDPKLNVKDLRKLHDTNDDIRVVDSSTVTPDQLNGLESFIIDVDALRDDLPSQLLTIGAKLPKAYYSRSKHLLVYGDDAKSKSLTSNELSFYNLSKSEYRLQKRVFDLIIGLLISPLILLGNLTKLATAMKNVQQVFRGRKSIMGYRKTQVLQLPKAKEPVYSIWHNVIDVSSEERIRSYAMHYSIFDDVYYLCTDIVSVVRAFGKQ